MRKIYYLLFVVVSMMFVACTDDDDTKESVKPEYMEVLDAAIFNESYYINISDEADWTVTKHPSWAVPVENSGRAGELLELFVEEYGEDPDRRDTVYVSLSNGKQMCIPILQHGYMTSEVNIEAGAIMDPSKIQQTYGVMYGVNVITQGTLEGLKYNIMNASPFDKAKLINAVKERGDPTAFFFEPIYSSRSESVSGSTTQALANQLAVNAGLEVGISAFKISVEAGYNKETSSDKRYYYALQEVQHMAGSSYLRPGMVRRLVDEKADIFQNYFNLRVARFKDAKDDETRKKAMREILDHYGTHIVTQGVLGGEMKISLKMEVTEDNSASNIHAALSLSAKVVDVEGEVDIKDSEKKASQNTTISLRSYGGNNVFSISPGTTFDEFRKMMTDRDKIAKWTKSIKDGSSLALIDMQTMPIWDLMPTPEMREQLREYIVGDYQKDIAKQAGDPNYKPDLYIIEGYKATGDKYGIGRVSIPELEQDIYVERTSVPELSTNELVTLIYSGPEGSINSDHAFFVGSSERRPAKITRNKTTGKIEKIEELIHMPVAPVLQVYLDATGDITLMEKGVPTLYSRRDVNWTEYENLDLSTFEDLTIRRPSRVYGSTDRIKYIKQDVSVILAGATFNSGLVCEGNATITLEDGSDNKISMLNIGGLAALESSFPGCTMTICGGPLGNGKLTADGTLVNDNPVSSNWYGIAGIGGPGNIVIKGGIITAKASERVRFDYKPSGAGIGSATDCDAGNISILGGTVTAIGGPGSAGIGTGRSAHDGYYGSTCGNITISNATVIARGGDNAPAIGSGVGFGNDDNKCGKIVIKRDIVKVEAHKGKNAPCVIGAGPGSSCAGVEIYEVSGDEESKVFEY